MFRVAITVRVREADGEEHAVQVLLSKTWKETEPLQLRQYLGAYYRDKRDIQKDSSGIPIVTVFLLGHRLGDVSVPVMYVYDKPYDYDGNVVSKGMPEPFIENLEHDSIIVQTPLLHDQVSNRLYKVLSVFDQSRAYDEDCHLLNYDEKDYEGDASLFHLVFCLTAAAASPKMQRHMDMEDEFVPELENRDTKIMMLDKKIVEQEEEIMRRDRVLKYKLGCLGI